MTDDTARALDLTPLVIEMTREMLESEGLALDTVDAETKLFGEGGVFDSMAIVSLIVAIEQEIEARHGAFVALADEKALSRSSSPYRTVASLARYASESLESA